tara:strand:+ start:2637 stop:3398 length:762 start_codon:yes stop_codon:yes gene_type:complete
MGFLKKTFKKIKKGVKKVIGKVGKVFNKLGPLGTIGLMIAAPYAINAMFGTNLSTLTSAKAATKATTDVATEATEEVIKKEVIKEGTKEVIKEGTKDTFTDVATDTLINSGEKFASDTISGTIDKTAETLLSKTGQFVKDVGTDFKEHYKDLFTPESIKEGTVDLAVAGTEAAILGAGGEDYSPPRAGIVQPRISIEQAQDAYVQNYGPTISQVTGQPIKNYQDVTNSLFYGNISPDFISAFSQPMYMQQGVS